MKTLIRCAPLAAAVAVVLLLYGGGHASSDPLAVATANAAVRCPDGFTVTVHGLPAGSAPTSSLSDACVLDLGIPAGAMGAPGIAGPVGMNGVSGYALRTTTLNASKSNSYRVAATAMCPAGKKAIGGGSSITGGDGILAVTTSQPTPNGQGWTARAVKFGRDRLRGRVAFKVTAVCAAVEPASR
jgi:hypothetical protein